MSRSFPFWWHDAMLGLTREYAGFNELRKRMRVIEWVGGRN